MTPPVFLLPDDRDAVYVPGAVIHLGGEEGRHAKVRRLQIGEAVDLIDGRGTRVSGVVAGTSHDELSVRIGEVAVEPAPRVRLVLVQALAKEQRDLQAIEAAVECGVDGVIPWAADRSVVQWRGPKADKGPHKWAATVRAATKQTRRAWLPPVGDLVDSTQLAAKIAEVVQSGGAAVVLHESATTPIAAVALPETTQPPKSVVAAGPFKTALETTPQTTSTTAETHSPHPVVELVETTPPPTPATTRSTQPPARDVLIVVGPEGGISDPELEAFAEAGAQILRLGPHVMRTSTPGPVAVAMLAQRLGRWDIPNAR